MAAIKQKEYLKKYLSLGKDKTEKKKKKKKAKSNNVVPSRLTIIDDNDDTFENAVKEDLLEDEDAPQIVAVIDDRPPSLQVDEKNNTKLWIPIGGNRDNATEAGSLKKSDIGDLSPPRIKIKTEVRRKENFTPSPPRKKSSSSRHKSSTKIEDRIKVEEVSPSRTENDYTPPRTSSNRKKASRWGSEDRDVSPLRYQTFKESGVQEDENVRKEYDDDFSPPRKRSKSVQLEMSREKETSRWESSNKKREKQDEKYKDDSDTSPPRKRSATSSIKEPHKEKTSRWESESDHSSSSKHHADKRRERPDKKSNKRHSDDDTSPPRKRNGSTPPNMMKTLDGKTAGLQDAKQLAFETSLLKRKEEELFNRMSTEISGANAATIVRDKKTGRIRNFEEEAAKNLEKQKRDDANKEKYSRWGRGMKQVEDATKRREDELNEMSKPLARYANDEDLERYLKEQEREGDPMLAYIRKKKKKKDVEEGKPMKPEYMGEFMPNRFGIKPGYRWDGVNRSNGYEMKWFEVQNSRLAQQEEAYKWSTEDM